jgi:SAM-dependent methyltransferase
LLAPYLTLNEHKVGESGEWDVMRTDGSARESRPRTDDRALRDIFAGMFAYPMVLVAHDLKVFPLLAERPRTLREIGDALKISARPAEALVAVCAALGLLQLRDECWSLTALAEDYLLEDGPAYFGGYLDLVSSLHSMYSFESVRKAVLTDAPRVYGGEEVFKSHEERADRARAFTQAMHSVALAPAMAWPRVVDLSGHRTLLDVGGGSGTHAIAAALRWPRLRAIVLDLATVCTVAEEVAAGFGLQARIRTHAADMWRDPFPPADVHFYSQVFHNWPPEHCDRLTRKSFESLEPGGRLLIHEILYNDEKGGPLAAAAMSVQMLLFCEGGRQYSGRDLTAMLADAGFAELEVNPTFGYWSIVSGRKPS